jgi:hypothetical protein
LEALSKGEFWLEERALHNSISKYQVMFGHDKLRMLNDSNLARLCRQQLMTAIFMRISLWRMGFLQYIGVYRRRGSILHEHPTLMPFFEHAHYSSEATNISTADNTPSTEWRPAGE